MGMHVTEYFKFPVPGNFLRATISIWISVHLVGLLSGCADNSTKTVVPDPMTPGQMLIGSWEFLSISIDSVLTTVPLDDRFWYFIAPQTMCSLEKRTDGTYGPDLSGAYGIFDSELIIGLGNGEQMNLLFAFSDNSDTLHLWESFEQLEVVYSMTRVLDAPENEWCP